MIFDEESPKKIVIPKANVLSTSGRSRSVSRKRRRSHILKKDIRSRKSYELIPTELENGKYKVWKNKPVLGEGAFGIIYTGLSVEDGIEVAIKFEPEGTKDPQLFNEHRLYKAIYANGTPGIPKFYWYGRTKDENYQVMILERLGPDLGRLFSFCDNHFSMKTILMLFEQLVSRIQAIHEKHYLHRDIKPENFLMGIYKTGYMCYALDFGLAKKYWNNGKHIKEATFQPMVGTVRYMSRNTHQGKEQSRRDDLEAIGYMVLFFARRGELPWMGTKGSTMGKTYDLIRKKKSSTSISSLCSGLPPLFSWYLKYVRNLEFTEEPDYDLIRKKIRTTFKELNLVWDFQYDWCKRYDPIFIDKKSGKVKELNEYYKGTDEEKRPRKPVIAPKIIINEEIIESQPIKKKIIAKKIKEMKKPEFSMSPNISKIKKMHKNNQKSKKSSSMIIIENIDVVERSNAIDISGGSISSLTESKESIDDTHGIIGDSLMIEKENENESMIEKNNESNDFSKEIFGKKEDDEFADLVSGESVASPAPEIGAPIKENVLKDEIQQTNEKENEKEDNAIIEEEKDEIEDEVEYDKENEKEKKEEKTEEFSIVITKPENNEPKAKLKEEIEEDDEDIIEIEEDDEEEDESMEVEEQKKERIEKEIKTEPKIDDVEMVDFYGKPKKENIEDNFLFTEVSGQNDDEYDISGELNIQYDDLEDNFDELDDDEYNHYLAEKEAKLEFGDFEF